MILLKAILPWWRELLIVVLGGYATFTILSPKKPIIVTKEVERKVIEYKTKIEYRDKERTVYRTTNKPDGTKIVEKEVENDKSVIDTKRSVKQEERVVTKQEAPPRLLEFGYSPLDSRVRVGLLYPISDTPFNIGGSIIYDTKKDIFTGGPLPELRRFGVEFGLIYRF